MTPPWSEWFVRGSEGALDKRRRGTNGEEVYYWRIGRGGGLHERARVGQDWIQVKKIINFEQKHLPTCSFYESSLPPIFFWVRWANLSKKNVQLFSIFIV